MLLRLLAELDAVRAVDLLADNLDLLLDREVEVVQELEVGFTLTGLDDGLRESERTSTTLRPVVADDGSVGTAGERLLADELELGGSVSAAETSDYIAHTMTFLSLTQTG